MKKALSVVLSLVMVLTLMPLTALAKDVVAISYVPENEVVAYLNTNGEMRLETDSDDSYYFYYFGVVGNSTGDKLYVTYDGDEEPVEYTGVWSDEFHKIVFESEDGDIINNYSTRDPQQDSHWTLDGDNYYYVIYAGYSCKVPVTVKVNPVSAISFTPAEKYTVVEHTHGEWRDDNNGGQYYDYNMPSFREGDILKVTLTESGETVTYTYSDEEHEFLDADGEALPNSDTELVTSHHGDNVWQLNSDNNHYFVVYYTVSSDPVYVDVVENPYSAIAFEKAEPVQYIEGTHMRYDEWDDAYYYDEPSFDLGDKLTVYDKNENPTVYTFTYDEETESRWDGRFESESGEVISREDVRINTDQRENPWSLGKNNCYVEFAGFTASFTVAIVENPVASIAFEKAESVVYYEGDTYYDGWDDADYYNTPYFRTGDKLTVTYTGQATPVVYTYSSRDWCFESESGDTINPDDVYIESNQRTTPWVLGDSNNCTVTYMGKSATFAVSIIENPVTAISYTPVSATFMENQGGYMNNNPEGAFYVYEVYIRTGDKLTVTYNDSRGTVTYTATTKVMNDQYQTTVFAAENGDEIPAGNVNVEENQYAQHWTVGNQNFYNVTYNGKTAQVQVTITENPVASIAYTPKNVATLYEGETYWDNWEQMDRYAIPQIQRGDVLSVTYKDERGTVAYTATFNDEKNVMEFVAQNGDVISTRGDNIGWYDMQYANPWSVGGEHNFYIFTYCGQETQVPVNIVANTVKSIAVTLKKSMMVFASDYEMREDPEDGVTFKEYRIPQFELGDVLSVTDTDDNTKDYVLTFDESDGERYFINGDEKIAPNELDCYAEQREHPWTVGGENSFTVKWHGATTTVPVTLIDTDVEEITFTRTASVAVTEYTNGEWRENERGERYFDYGISLAGVGDVLTVKYINGNTVSYTVKFDNEQEGAYLEAANGERLSQEDVGIYTNQWDKPWVAEEQNEYFVKFRGVTCTVPVTVNHNYQDHVVAPTCTAAGYTEHTCTACGKTYRDSETKALSHQYTQKVTPANQKANGKIENICSNCGDVQTTVIYKPQTFTLKQTAYVYTGKAIKPTVTVKDSKGKAIAASNYTLTYNNNKNVGTATVALKFKGNYSGTKNLTFTINPKATKLTKVTAGKKAFTAKWNKQATQTTGYELQYALKSNFKSAKTVNIGKTGTVKKAVSGLKANKKYYVRVRTYKKVGGKKFYSDWSAAKAVTTLK